ncbi:unnamed protein product [Ectocarpus sp. 8 AP-2014]
MRLSQPEKQRERLDSRHATNAIPTGNDISKGLEEHQVASLWLEEHQLASLGGELVLFQPLRFGRAGDRAEGDGSVTANQEEAPPGGDLVLCKLKDSVSTFRAITVFGFRGGYCRKAET